jgi:hypothetical protein
MGRLILRNCGIAEAIPGIQVPEYKLKSDTKLRQQRKRNAFMANTEKLSKEERKKSKRAARKKSKAEKPKKPRDYARGSKKRKVKKLARGQAKR